MHTPPPLPPPSYADVLLQLHANCPSLEAVVLASRDGQLLQTWGDLPAAATASAALHLGQALGKCLALVRRSTLTESLLWAPPSVWYWAQLERDQVLLACCQSLDHAGALRLAGQLAVQHILQLQLQTPAETRR